jgi:hypothetical protein
MTAGRAEAAKGGGRGRDPGGLVWNLHLLLETLRPILAARATPSRAVS